MKINIGQIIIFFLAVLCSVAAGVIIFREEKPLNVYFYLDSTGTNTYLRTPEKLFFDEKTKCITNGEESVVCEVKYFRTIYVNKP